jgi:hypothetical protein
VGSRRNLLGMVLCAALAACSTGSASPTPLPPSVTPSGAAADPTARTTATPNAVSGPLPPSGVTFDERLRPLSDGTYETIQTATWSSPSDEGVEIVAYGVTACVEEHADASPGASGPCVVEPVELAESALVPLAAAPARRGHVEWSWIEPGGCNIGLAYDPDGPSYVAVVLAAHSASGRSRLVIAEPGSWFVPEPGSMPC